MPSPKGLPVRPTTDRTREALFNILSHRLEWPETRVLDLFSGTGSVSLECLSRGASTVVSVDRDHRCIQALKRLQADWKLPGRVIKREVSRFLAGAPSSYDLIFMDPPYAMPAQEQLVIAAQKRWLAADGILILEHAPPATRFEQLDGFQEVRIYGSSCLSFFGYIEESGSAV